MPKNVFNSLSHKISELSQDTHTYCYMYREIYRALSSAGREQISEPFRTAAQHLNAFSIFNFFPMSAHTKVHRFRIACAYV